MNTNASPSTQRLHDELSQFLSKHAADASFGVAAGSFVFAANITDQCCRHYELMQRWNKTHNLTRITSPQEAAIKHYGDSLLGMRLALAHMPTDLSTTNQPANQPVWADAGTGAGFPGMIAALAYPEQTFHLVEPAQKRASFLQLALGSLNVKNVTVYPKTIQEYLQILPNAHIQTHIRPTIAISRATFSEDERIAVLKQLFHNHIHAGAFWLGPEISERQWQKEIQSIFLGLATSSWHPYSLGKQGERAVGLFHVTSPA